MEGDFEGCLSWRVEMREKEKREERGVWMRV